MEDQFRETKWIQYWGIAFVSFFYFLLFTLFFFLPVSCSGLQLLASSDPVSVLEVQIITFTRTSCIADRTVANYVIHTESSTVKWRLNEVTTYGYLLALFPYMLLEFLWRLIDYKCKYTQTEWKVCLNEPCKTEGEELEVCLEVPLEHLALVSAEQNHSVCLDICWRLKEQVHLHQ